MATLNKVISFHYTLRNSEGKEIESSHGNDPFAFITGIGQIIPGLETVLSLMGPGDKRKIDVPAKQAYGERDANLIVRVPKTELPNDKIKVGDQLHADDGQQMRVVVVTEIGSDHVTVDANHPLAGQDLQFDVEILNIRDATKEEMTHGHVHGPGGIEH